MSFTSPAFFLFLPAVLLLYQLFPAKYRFLLLLAASCFFYAFYDVRLLGLIFLTTLVSYLSAICMEQAETKKGKRLALAFTMTVCLGILFLFKYLNLAADGIFALCRLSGADISFDGFHILLPMGISFYVFQTMSYAFDVYGGKMAAEKHLGYYALFVVFFPQLVAGPIERPGDLLPQLKRSRPICKENLLDGLCLFLRGYAKKILIADYLAGFVDAAYENIKEAGGAALLFATLLFAIQIYCDFSGYCDIALGCARFLGIRLSQNFRRPYQAVSIRDFWHRWHISLTRWFTDYLYIPLGGSKRGLFCHCRNIMITFLVSGLWHGADLSFVCWGGLHGIYLILETLLSHGMKRLLSRKQDTCQDFLTSQDQKVRSSKRPFPCREICCKLKTILQRTLTFLLVCFAWIFFRAATLDDAFLVIHEIFTHWQIGSLFAVLDLTRAKLILLAGMVLLLPFLEKLPAVRSSELPLSQARMQCSTALLYFLLITAILLCRCLVLTEQGATAFIYFQF